MADLIDWEHVVQITDGKLGPTYRLDDGTEIFMPLTGQPQVRLVGVEEFANPWHDEQGKFAPKGTGTQASPGGDVGVAGEGDALNSPTINGIRRNDVGGIPVASTSTTGVDARQLSDDVLAGKDIVVKSSDVDDVLIHYADDTDPVDMTRITVEGSETMFSQMRENGIPRVQMPQIPVERLGDFQQKLSDAGITFKPEIVDPQHLKATQSELDGRKVGKIIEDLRAGEFDLTKDPMWVSNDGHILDGHHRWAGGAAISADCGGCIRVPIIRVDVGITELLQFANAYNASEGIEKQGFGAPGPHETKKAAARVRRSVFAVTPLPEPDENGVYGMATDAADGITDEDLADLPHGNGSAFPGWNEPPAAAPVEPEIQASVRPQFRLRFANPWHDDRGRFAPKGTGTMHGVDPLDPNAGSLESWGYVINTDYEGESFGNDSGAADRARGQLLETRKSVIELFDEISDGPSSYFDSAAKRLRSGTLNDIKNFANADVPMGLKGDHYEAWRQSQGRIRKAMMDRVATAKTATAEALRDGENDNWESIDIDRLADAMDAEQINWVNNETGFKGKSVTYKPPSGYETSIPAADAAWLIVTTPGGLGRKGEIRLRAPRVAAVAASTLPRAEFANPWHDEMGRFAPKGMGRQVQSIARSVRNAGDRAMADDIDAIAREIRAGDIDEQGTVEALERIERDLDRADPGDPSIRAARDDVQWLLKQAGRARNMRGWTIAD